MTAVAGEIEKRADAQLQRDLTRVTNAGPARMAGVGGVLAAGGAGLVAVGGGLSWMALVPFYFMAGLGALLIGIAGLSWLRQRRIERDQPPVPPARLLPP